MNGTIIKLLVYVDPMLDVHITAKVGDLIYRVTATRPVPARAAEGPLTL